MEYRIEYMLLALEHLRQCTARDQRRVVDAVDEQLQHQANVPTRNRKPLRPNDLATWEVRIGELRVFYDVLLPLPKNDVEKEQPAAHGEQVSEPTVSILAIGVKMGNRVLIGNEEIEL